MKTLAIPAASWVDIRRLRLDLTGFDRIPRDFCGYFPNTSIWDKRGHRIGLFNVVVQLQQRPTRPSIYDTTRMCHASGHRMMVQCDCGRLIPVGRLGQHKH